MVAVLGLILWTGLNIWLSIFAIVATVPTWGETLMTGGFWSKSLGVVLWIIALSSWVWMFSSIDIKVVV